MSNLNTVLSDNNTDLALVTTLNTITSACKSISAQLHNGALAGILGSADNTNVQGETQKKLDVISNDILKERLLASISVRALTSEEEDEFVDGNHGGQHIVHFDPLRWLIKHRYQRSGRHYLFHLSSTRNKRLNRG